VVSHRKAALHRADRIVLLKDGKVEAEGPLDELLDTCEEMQRLWRGDLAPDRPEHVPPRHPLLDPVLERALDRALEGPLDQEFEQTLDYALDR
jgi:hypothetical protein